MSTAVLCALAVLVICLLGTPLPAAGFGWDLLGALGLGGLAFMLALAFESEAPARQPRLTTHRNLALAATALAALHALGYPILDPIALEYLKPKAPGHMLAGIGALLLLTALTITAFPGPRRRVYATFTSFRRWHLGLGIAALLLAAWHTIDTGFAVRAGVPGVALTALLVIVPAAAWLARRGGTRTAFAALPESPAVADRHALLALLIVLLLATLSALARNP